MRFKIPALGVAGHRHIPGIIWQVRTLSFCRAGCYHAPGWALVYCKENCVALIFPLGMN